MDIFIEKPEESYITVVTIQLKPKYKDRADVKKRGKEKETLSIKRY